MYGSVDPADSEPVGPVTFDDVSNVSETGATFSGELHDLHGGDSVDCWFRYRAAGEEPVQDSAKQALTEPGAFTATVDDLMPGMAYDVYAMAETQRSTYASRIYTFEAQTADSERAAP